MEVFESHRCLLLRHILLLPLSPSENNLSLFISLGKNVGKEKGKRSGLVFLFAKVPLTNLIRESELPSLFDFHDDDDDICPVLFFLSTSLQSNNDKTESFCFVLTPYNDVVFSFHFFFGDLVRPAWPKNKD